MKYLKRFNESYDLDPVRSNLERILYKLEKFDFITKVDIKDNYFIIEITKNSDGIRVFNSIDIKDVISEVNEYLTLGEGLHLEDIESVEVRGFQPEKRSVNINQLFREGKSFIKLVFYYCV